MAKQSKGFGKPVHVQKQEIISSQRLKKFSKQFESGPLSERLAGTVMNAVGVPRMSDTLEAFAEPYLDPEMELEERQKLFGLAAVAWNAAVLPQAESGAMIDRFLELLPSQDSVVDGIREMINEMVERKLEHFADIKRTIVSLELTDTADTFYLSVASTEYKGAS